MCVKKKRKICLHLPGRAFIIFSSTIHTPTDKIVLLFFTINFINSSHVNANNLMVFREHFDLIIISWMALLLEYVKLKRNTLNLMKMAFYWQKNWLFICCIISSPAIQENVFKIRFHWRVLTLLCVCFLFAVDKMCALIWNRCCGECRVPRYTADAIRIYCSHLISQRGEAYSGGADPVSWKCTSNTWQY